MWVRVRQYLEDWEIQRGINSQVIANFKSQRDIIEAQGELISLLTIRIESLERRSDSRPFRCSP